MAEKHADEGVPVQPLAPSPPSSSATSIQALDRHTVQALFAALRTSIPADVQQALLRDSLEELKFLIARQPRLSSFHHRRRESLRHPALAMTTKNYYQLCRRKRIELAVQAVAAEHLGQQQLGRSDGQDGQADGAEVQLAQRESELVDLLLAEYAQSGGFHEEVGWLHHQGASPNPGESTRFSTSVPFGSRGLPGTSAQLMSSISAMETRNEASLSMGESRNGAGTFFTEVGNTSLSGMSAALRNGGSIMHHSSLGVGNYGAAPDGAGLLPAGCGRLNSASVNSVSEIGGAGYQRNGRGGRVSAGAGRFFSKRHDRAEGGVGNARGGGIRGDGGPRWDAEMHAMVIRRAEEELKAGTGGDPYLLSSSRPIEVLLTCYGGAQRDSAVMAMGAATLLTAVDNFAASSSATTPAEADPLFNAVVEEDVRWDQLAQCYRQLLREANAVRQAAALALARDPLVNDVIRRFWERLTVSPAAQHAHKAQEASKKRDVADAAAFSKRVHSRIISGEPDEDDLDEIPQANEDGTENPVGGSAATRSLSRAAPRSSPKEASDLPVRKGPKSGGREKKKRKTSLIGFSTAGSKAAEPISAVAYYMTPLQYVYLHSRLAHVLLPDSSGLDMELLYFIQEDLLVDAAYSESDPAQMLYFGEAPRLTNNNSARSRVVERRRGSGNNRFAAWEEDESAANDDDTHKGTSLCQRFKSVRRHGYALGEDGGVSSRQDDNFSVLVRHSTAINIGGGGSEEGSLSYGGAADSANNGGGGGNDDGDVRETAMNALPLVNMCFSIAELPSLTYQQFWCSMMELADNWTCCAGHPVETAIFLWELYAEVFGHNWGAEDEALAMALEEKVATVSKAERARIDEEVVDTLSSFNKLVKALRARERQGRPTPGSGAADGLGLPLNDDGSVVPGGRRRTFRKSASTPTPQQEGTPAWESSWSSDSNLSLTEWNALAGDNLPESGEWVYAERVDEDGVKHRFRRRVVHRKSRIRKAGEDRTKSTSQPSSDDTSEEVSFLVEEELNEDGGVVKQRKRRRKEVQPAAAVTQGERRQKANARAKDSASAVTSVALRGRRRRYEEDNPKQLRRLEVRRRVEAGSSRGSSLTSWTSYDDGLTEGRCNGGRRRARIRRTGQRRARLIEGEEEYDDEGHSVESGLATTSAVARGEKKGGVVAKASDVAGQQGSAAAQSSLTPEQLADLHANKDWLCTVLGAKGIYLPPHMFDDPAEQVLLYELLRLTRESEAKIRSGDGGSRGDGDGFFDVGDGQGLGGTDLSRLAALLAQSAAFNLEGLDDSALMRRLLGDAGAGGSQFLSPNQLQGILLALVNGQKPTGEGGSGTETEGMRARRLHLLRMLEELQARERQQQLQEQQAREEAERLALAAAAAGGPASKAADPAETSAVLPSRLPIGASQLHSLMSGAGGASPAAGDPARRGATSAGYTRLVPSPPPAKGSAGNRNGGTEEEEEWAVSPATAAERREQERLFRELEAYWSDRSSQRGRYRVHLIEYTEEQLNEFFAHLHLGSRQRALLRGRAPLAGATSLVGGTLHQDPPYAATHGDGANNRLSVASPAPGSLSRPLRAAPVKLFTLTTEASLGGALRESYESYVSDRAFSKSNNDRVRAEPPSSGPLAHPAQVSLRRQQQQQHLPPLSQLGRPRETVSTKAGALRNPVSSSATRTPAATALTSRATTAVAAAATKKQQLLSTLVPPARAMASRRSGPHSSRSPLSSLPKL